MLENEIKNSFKIFDELITNLINSFMKYNLDETTIIVLAKMTKHLMSFTQKILIKLLFKFFNSLGFLDNKFTEDLIDVDAMINMISEQISESLKIIQKDDDELKQKKNMEDIVKYLTFLKDVINTLSNLFLSVLKFQTEIISEDEFREEYRKFRSDIDDYKKKLDKMTYKESVVIPIN